MSENKLSLLPRDQVEFRSKSYWDRFFSERRGAFEWSVDSGMHT
jgi:hypothetical protein